MNLSLRQQQIMNEARTHGQVLVDALVERFEVTPQTIRKDLNELCELKLLSRVHGGAVLTTGKVNVGYELRQNIASIQKQALASLCAAAIPNNSSLFLNIGTTTEAVAMALLEHQELMVITNNLNVANILIRNPSFEVIVAGGVLRHADRAIIGEATADFMRQFKLDFAVVGTSALDPDGTLLDFDYREVRVTQAILQNARERFLVTDRSKLARSAPVRVAHVSQLSGLFMDALDSEELRAICEQHGVALHTVD
ncbi:MAG: DeoR/GlpR transcriptional regulator [Thiothrix sp.]|nr:DeoR/GlpR transcriptional regulator [Thiothrix sp.]